MGERRRGGRRLPPREERQRCSCRAATSSTADCGRSPLPVNQEVSRSGSATDRPWGERLCRSKHQLIWSSAVQFLPFLFNQKEQKIKEKNISKKLKKADCYPESKSLRLIHFVSSLIVINARNVKYIKLNIYIKRFWTSSYHSLEKKNQAGLRYEARHWRTWMRPVRQRNHKVLFVLTCFTLSPSSEGGV